VVFSVAVLLAAGGAPAVAGLTPTSDNKPTASGVADRLNNSPDNGHTKTENSGVETKSENDTTIDVIVVFSNDTARQGASFGPNVTVTGGRNIRVAPVLFATAKESALPALGATRGVVSVGIDQRLERRTPASDVEQVVRSASGVTTTQTVPWGIQRIGAPAITDRVTTTDAKNVTVAVVDSGVDYTHPDLSGSVIWGANFTYGSERYGVATADDNSGHGTAVAGIVAAKDNNRGIVGIVPGVRLYAIKVLRANSVGTISSLIKGIDAAVKGPDGVIRTADDADIVLLSLGTEAINEQLSAVVDNASDHAVLVGAAGNVGGSDTETGEVIYPARYPGVLAVAASDRENETATFSPEGAVDITAPGVSVMTLASGGGVKEFSGTSAAAPHVAGAVAAMLAADRAAGTNLTGGELRARLMNTTQDIGPPGPDRFSGAGLVRTDRGVAAVVSGSASRTVTDADIARGGDTNITVTTYAAGEALTVSESFIPTLADAEVNRVQVDGDSTRAVFRAANGNGTRVTVGGLDIGARVVITYTVRVSADAPTDETYTITGRATNGVTETDLGSSTLAVQPGLPGDPVDIYDADEDGNIDISELGSAATDYANRELSITQLGEIASAYANRTISVE
jgi:subtilisin family serine protease